MTNPNKKTNKENTTYLKLPYTGAISVRTKKNICELCKRFYEKTDINIVLTPFKTGSLFSCKDRSPHALRSFVVYKSTRAGCQSCYIGKTRCHLATRVKEHVVTDKKSHIMKHLPENKTCKSLCDKGCFQVTMLLLLSGWKLRRLYTLTGWSLTWINKKNMWGELGHLTRTLNFTLVILLITY